MRSRFKLLLVRVKALNSFNLYEFTKSRMVLTLIFCRCMFNVKLESISIPRYLFLDTTSKSFIERLWGHANIDFLINKIFVFSTRNMHLLRSAHFFSILHV